MLMGNAFPGTGGNQAQRTKLLVEGAEKRAVCFLKLEKNWLKLTDSSLATLTRPLIKQSEPVERILSP